MKVKNKKQKVMAQIPIINYNRFEDVYPSYSDFVTHCLQPIRSDFPTSEIFDPTKQFTSDQALYNYIKRNFYGQGVMNQKDYVSNKIANIYATYWPDVFSAQQGFVNNEISKLSQAEFRNLMNNLKENTNATSKSNMAISTTPQENSTPTWTSDTKPSGKNYQETVDGFIRTHDITNLDLINGFERIRTMNLTIHINLFVRWMSSLFSFTNLQSGTKEIPIPERIPTDHIASIGEYPDIPSTQNLVNADLNTKTVTNKDAITNINTNLGNYYNLKTNDRSETSLDNFLSIGTWNLQLDVAIPGFTTTYIKVIVTQSADDATIFWQEAFTRKGDGFDYAWRLTNNATTSPIVWTTWNNQLSPERAVTINKIWTFALGIDAGTNKITNLANGVDQTDAMNISQGFYQTNTTTATTEADIPNGFSQQDNAGVKPPLFTDAKTSALRFTRTSTSARTTIFVGRDGRNGGLIALYNGWDSPNTSYTLSNFSSLERNGNWVKQTINGIDVANNLINNVAPAVNGGDAVNLNQLNDATNDFIRFVQLPSYDGTFENQPSGGWYDLNGMSPQSGYPNNTNRGICTKIQQNTADRYSAFFLDSNNDFYTNYNPSTGWVGWKLLSPNQSSYWITQIITISGSIATTDTYAPATNVRSDGINMIQPDGSITIPLNAQAFEITGILSLDSTAIISAFALFNTTTGGSTTINELTEHVHWIYANGQFGIQISAYLELPYITNWVRAGDNIKFYVTGQTAGTLLAQNRLQIKVLVAV